MILAASATGQVGPFVVREVKRRQRNWLVLVRLQSWDDLSVIDVNSCESNLMDVGHFRGGFNGAIRSNTNHIVGVEPVSPAYFVKYHEV